MSPPPPQMPLATARRIEQTLDAFLRDAETATPERRRALAIDHLERSVLSSRDRVWLVQEVLEHVRGLAVLPRIGRELLAVDALEREVANGGLHQYFFNSAGNDLEDAIAGLERIGATDALARLRAALAMFDRTPDADRGARWKQLEAIDPGGLHAIDREWPWISERLTASLLADLGELLSGRGPGPLLRPRGALTLEDLAQHGLWEETRVFDLLLAYEGWGAAPDAKTQRLVVASRIVLASGAELPGYAGARASVTGFVPFDVDRARPVVLLPDGRRMRLWIDGDEDVPESERAIAKALAQPLFPIVVLPRADISGVAPVTIDGFYGVRGTHVFRVPFP